MIRWGIIGTGSIARKFAEDLREVPDASLTVVGSRTMLNAEAFAAEFDAARACGSYEEAAQDPGVDIFYIATPHPLHCANTLLCLDAGKPVLCEKPFAMNAAEAEQMVRSAREKKLFLMEAMWTRFLPVMVRLQELLRARTLGEVRAVQATFSYLSRFDPAGRIDAPELGGGALLDVGVYCVSFAHWLFGTPDGITGTASLGPTGVDELSAATLSWKDGRMAQLFCGIRSAGINEAVVLGDQGTIRIHREWWRPERMTLERPGIAPETIELPPQGRGYGYEAMEAGQCLAAGRLESGVMPLEETLSVMRTMDTLRKLWGLKYPMEP